jgi:hypothetical protein
MEIMMLKISSNLSRKDHIGRVEVGGVYMTQPITLGVKDALKLSDTLRDQALIVKSEEFFAKLLATDVGLNPSEVSNAIRKYREFITKELK